MQLLDLHPAHLPCVEGVSRIILTSDLQPKEENMTTTVIVKAHCSSDKEVIVAVENKLYPADDSTFILQNGETRELYAYDARVITVREVLK